MAERSTGRRWIGYSIVLVGAALLLCYEIDEPFVGQHDTGGASMANYARNMVRYGYWETKMGLIVDSGSLPDEHDRHYYLHGSPLLAFLISLSFRVFGVHEWAARLVPIAQALMCVLLVILICERLWGRGVAVVASGILVVSPVFAYYGRVVEFVPFGFAYLLTMVYAYVRWYRRGSDRWLWLLAVVTLVGAVASFEAWFLAFLLMGHHVLTAKRRSGAVLLLAVAVVLGLGLLAGHVSWLIGARRMAADALAALKRRGVLAEGDVGFAGAFVRQAVWAVEYVTPVPLLLCAIWAGTTVVRWCRSRLSWRRDLRSTLLLLLMANPVLIALALPGYSGNHEYSLYGLMPPVAIASALGLRRVWLWIVGAGRARWRAAGAWAVCGLAGALFLSTALLNLGKIHSRDFFSQWHRLACQLNGMTKPHEGIAMNVCNPLGFPGCYLPFYLDRRIGWGVGTIGDAQKKVAADGRYVLAAFFVQYPDTGEIRMSTLTAQDLRSISATPFP